jgi:hypothetical protein
MKHDDIVINLFSFLSGYSDMRYITADTGLQSTSRGQAIPSPLRKISREPFDERIRKILQKKTSNPLLK